MEKIGIITNLSKDSDLVYTKEVIEWAISQGLTPIISKQIYKHTRWGYTYGMNDEVCKNCDFIVVLGGDGTILEVARSAAIYDAPIIGINLGTLGYLTDVEKSEGIHALNMVIKGQYKKEKRMMIEAEIEGEDNGHLIALNDICMLRGTLSKLMNVEIMVNNQYIDTYKADGIIVSTPTGSTAYNLSAGGPILKPDIELIAITPICPHKINSRSSVISGADIISMTVGDSYGGNVILSLDGQEHILLKYGQKINVKRSAYYTTVIKTTDLGFYDILRRKFYGK